MQLFKLKNRDFNRLLSEVAESENQGLAGLDVEFHFKSPICLDFNSLYEPNWFAFANSSYIRFSFFFFPNDSILELGLVVCGKPIKGVFISSYKIVMRQYIFYFSNKTPFCIQILWLVARTFSGVSVHDLMDYINLAYFC